MVRQALELCGGGGSPSWTGCLPPDNHGMTHSNLLCRLNTAASSTVLIFLPRFCHVPCALQARVPLWCPLDPRVSIWWCDSALPDSEWPWREQSRRLQNKAMHMIANIHVLYIASRYVMLSEWADVWMSEWVVYWFVFYSSPNHCNILVSVRYYHIYVYKKIFPTVVQKRSMGLDHFGSLFIEWKCTNSDWNSIQI